MDKEECISISSVRLISGGSKGIEVTYEKTLMKNKLPFKTVRKEKRMLPVQKELTECFNELGEHVREICMLDKELDGDCIDVHGIKVKASSFSLKVSVSLLEDSVLSFWTPFVSDDDNYVGYNACNAVVNRLVTEVVKYMEGEVTFDEKQYVLDFHAKKDKDFNPETFEVMSHEQLVAEAKLLLENNGCLVMDSAEVGEAIGLEEYVEAVPAIGECNTEPLVIPIATMEKIPVAPVLSGEVLSSAAMSFQKSEDIKIVGQINVNENGSTEKIIAPSSQPFIPAVEVPAGPVVNFEEEDGDLVMLPGKFKSQLD